ncbi:hypothetical protein F4778DRAFT_802798 [Xylariomycetidae sp. FL2044]|nr:hypothetical protein F4778DRAFT_802798 [Xylariomycetidae sp. FL2044]
MSTTAVVYMAEPPPGEDRFAMPSLGGMQNRVAVALHIVGLMFFVLRLYSRVFLAKLRLRTEDYLCGVAELICWGFVAITICMVELGGAGRAFWQVTYDEYIQLSKITVASGIAYNLAAVVAKLSILVFYLSISPEKYYRWTVLFMMGCFSLYSALFVLISIFGCRPVSAAWDPALAASAQCIDKGKFYLGATVSNVIMDTVILLIPLRIIVPLQVPKRQKVMLLFVFATGGLAIAAAVQNSLLTSRLWRSANYTYDTAIELMWLHVETSCCVVCASLSSLKPLVSRFFGGRFLSGGGRSGGKNSYGGVSGERSRSNPARSRGTKLGRPANAFELESVGPSDSTQNLADDEAKLWESKSDWSEGKRNPRSVVVESRTH